MTAFALVMGAFAVLLVLRLPIAIAIGIATLIGITYSGISVGFLSQLAYSSLDNFTLMAIPLFILAGYLMETGGISRRIVNFAASLIGNVKGGLAIVTVLACMFFAAISGSSPATVAAIGTMMIPSMVRKGYDVNFAAAVTASAGSLGILIPPSIPMIIYGITAEVSIAKMFLAGIVPGLLVGLGLIVVVRICAARFGGGSENRPIELLRVLRTLREGVWSLITPVIILGGIYSGVFTPTESAVVAVLYALFIGLFVYREIRFSELYGIFLNAAVTTGTVMIILGFATAFARYLTLNQVPQEIAALVLSYTDSKYVILAIFIVMILITGMFLETAAQILIYTPLFLPLLTQLGVDPIHFGIILIIGTELGLLTPPVGINLFVVQGITQGRIGAISMRVIPFVISMLLVQIVLTFAPPLVTGIPNYFYP